MELKQHGCQLEGNQSNDGPPVYPAGDSWTLRNDRCGSVPKGQQDSARGFNPVVQASDLLAQTRC
jgi:hypothetical protein